MSSPPRNRRTCAMVMFAPRERVAVRPDAACGGVRDPLSSWCHWHLTNQSSAASPISGRYGHLAAGSDHPGLMFARPISRFIGDVLAEVGGRARKGRDAQAGKPCLDAGIG